MSKAKYIIPGTVKEAQIENDVSNYFGIISGRTNINYHLKLTDELKTGADKVYNDSKGFLIYIQFKASNGLKSIKDYPASSRSNRSKLEDVREYRHKYRFNDNPTLYFKLRNKSKVKAKDFQHNLLLEFANQAQSQAIYVANLELDKDSYNQKLWNSANLENHPFEWKYYRDIPFQVLAKQIAMIPFLKEHVSIIPTSRVNNSKHYYSYSEIGTNVVFHSPENISSEVTNLGNFLRDQFLGIYENKIQLDNISNLYDYVQSKDIINEIGETESIDGLMEFGEQLFSEYGLKQYLIFESKLFGR